MNDLTVKYNFDSDKFICVYYRSGDKKSETPIDTPESFIKKTKEVLSENPSKKVIVMSDNTSFEKLARETFEDIVIITEIRETMYKQPPPKPGFTELDAPQGHKGRNQEHGLYMVASVMLLCKCHSIIIGSGNVSLWLALLRGNNTNLHQNLRKKWV
jgi:hypothetical protein